MKAGMDDEPGRLHQHHHVVVPAVDDVERNVLRLRFVRRRRQIDDDPRAALILREASVTKVPSSVTWPSPIRAFSRDRESEGMRRASAASSVRPRFSAFDSMSIGPAVGAGAPRSRPRSRRSSAGIAGDLLPFGRAGGVGSGRGDPRHPLPGFVSLTIAEISLPR